MTRGEIVKLAKLKKKLIYSALLMLLSIVMLISTTLGWFQVININEVSALSYYYPGVKFLFFKSVDANQDGIPDVGEDGKVIYTEQNPKEVKISNIYPGCRTDYRVVINASTNVNKLSVFLNDFTPVDENNVDLTNAMKVAYTNPKTEQDVDDNIFNLLDENRNVTFFTEYALSSTQPFIFNYSIYMDGNAGNEYKNKDFVIGKVVFTLS